MISEQDMAHIATSEKQNVCRDIWRERLCQGHSGCVPGRVEVQRIAD